MSDLRHKRAGNTISEPEGWDELELTKDFLKRNEDASINITELIFSGEVGRSVKDRALNGLSGGVGIYEGEPYDIEVGDIGDPSFIFKGYLDYSDGVEFIGCNKVKVPLKKRQSSDWLNDVADGFSFRYLFDKGIITQNDLVKVDYVINYVPDNMQVILLAISLFMMGKELKGAIKEVADAGADVVDASMPVLGVGVGVGAVAVTAWDIGNVILVILKLIAKIVYTIAIVIAIKNLMQEIIEQLLPKKRTHLGVRLITLFERSCQHLGLTLSSKLLTDRKEWVMIPAKSHRGGEKPKYLKDEPWVESGVPTVTDGMDTFGDLMRIWLEVFNADYRIVDGVLKFERVDYWDSVSTFKIGDFFTDQTNLIDNYKTNSNEIVANYNINWNYDTQDQNTLDDQEGRVFQAIIEPKIINNKDLVSLKGLQEVAVPLSLGLRKNELTNIEEVMKKLGQFVDTLTGILGGGTNFASKIENRKGTLLLSSHFITIPKMVVMKGNKLDKNLRQILSAEQLFFLLHEINLFTEKNGKHNQWIRFENVKIPFCLKDFVSLLENNHCKDWNDAKSLIEKLNWKVWEDYATIDFRVNEKHTNNLKVRYTK